MAARPRKSGKLKRTHRPCQLFRTLKAAGLPSVLGTARGANSDLQLGARNVSFQERLQGASTSVIGRKADVRWGAIQSSASDSTLTYALPDMKGILAPTAGARSPQGISCTPPRSRTLRTLFDVQIGAPDTLAELRVGCYRRPRRGHLGALARLKHGKAMRYRLARQIERVHRVANGFKAKESCLARGRV